MRLALCAVLPLLVACGSAVNAPDAGDSGVAVDAGTPDAGSTAALTWTADVQPLLWAKCAQCHAADAGQRPFASSYPVMLEASTLCPGAQVGACVARALQAQEVEGTGCRTFIVQPFHREGWICLTPEEVGRVVKWQDAGMLEH